MTDITELAQSLKRRAASANEFGEGLFFIKADDVIALVEALEKAQAKADVYDMLRDDYGLREKGVGLADFVDWQAKRIAEMESLTVTVKLPDIMPPVQPVADSEPVAYIFKHPAGRLFWALTDESNKGQNDVMPVYASPQPAPVVPAVSDDMGEIRVGRLPTMNQDDYPGLGDWWVQLRIGEDSDEVLARVYGATPQEANNRAEALACRAAMLNGVKP